METVTTTTYKCEICGTPYGYKESALACEARAMTGDKGAQVGTKIRITTGQSVGKTATVTKRWIYDKEWGHYAWERYWHTVGLSADIDNSPMSRQLTFDDYEVID